MPGQDEQCGVGEQLETWYPHGITANTAARPSSPRSGIKDAPCAGSLDVSRQELFPTTGSVTSQKAQCDLLRAVEAEECQSQHGGCSGEPML